MGEGKTILYFVIATFLKKDYEGLAGITIYGEFFFILRCKLQLVINFAKPN